MHFIGYRGSRRPSPAKLRLRRFSQECGAQSLIEVAIILPTFFLLICYGIDFGYFFMAAASLSSSARNAAMYGTQGYTSTGQGSLPAIGATSTPASVAGVAYGNMSGFLNASTAVAVQLCTNSNGTVTCSSSPASSPLILSSYQPDADPEAALFDLRRVDVVYTVAPPVPLRFFSITLVPSLNFHRLSEMRVSD